jgi:TPR repeat protein
MNKILLGIAAALSLNVSASQVGQTVLMTESEYSHDYEIALKQVQHKDKGKAFNTMLTYAKYGEKVAQYMVANFYLTGTGTEQNVQEGLVWMGVAVEQHTKEWEDAYEKLTSKLPPEHLTLLNKLVAERTALYGAKAQHMSCDIEAAVTGTNRRFHVCTKNIDSIKRVTVVKYE